ncbi:hypothetical protein EVAR_14468_1 [Eumeta japonica]|uniref:Uncharacterized protein n=1 Tax=Eumeta variegata TaxID=151549 RepID=A0A4C1U2Y9_EUMVA|nr:hypothetical protein EVAR_14468_1 [Eumeta japonica]
MRFRGRRPPPRRPPPSCTPPRRSSPRNSCTNGKKKYMIDDVNDFLFMGKYYFEVLFTLCTYLDLADMNARAFLKSTTTSNKVRTAKQKLSLSDSYLPVVMQVMAHLTDQMSFETKDEPTKPEQTSKPTSPMSDYNPTTSHPTTTTKRPTSSTSRPTSTTSWWSTSTSRPTSTWWSTSTKRPTSTINWWSTSTKRPTSTSNWWSTSTSRPTSTTNWWSTNKPTSTRPTYTTTGIYKPTTSGWWVTYTTKKSKGSGEIIKLKGQKTVTAAWCTQHCSPEVLQTLRIRDLNAASRQRILSYRCAVNFSKNITLDQLTTPFHKPGLYAPAKPLGPGLYIRDQFVLLPANNEAEYSILAARQSLEDDPLLSSEKLGQLLSEGTPVLKSNNKQTEDEYSDENLQYLSPDIREMLKLAHDPNDERVIDIWADEESRAGVTQSGTKQKLSQSNLRLLLLYDLLSREAKRQKLNDHHGFSESVMKELTESSSGGARRQLSFVLTKMLDRHDCDHDYANNRAKEMIAELAKDETKLSSEIRYLQPLVYEL